MTLKQADCPVTTFRDRSDQLEPCVQQLGVTRFN